MWSAVGLTRPAAADSAQARAVPAIATTPVSQRSTALTAPQPRWYSPASPWPAAAVGLAAVLGGALLVAGAAGALPRWHGRSLLGGRGGAVAARVGAFVLRPAALLVVAVVLAAAIGLGANAAGGYYTSWGDILSMVAG